MAPRLKLSELGKRLAAARKRSEQTCPECGAAFVGLTMQRYCSPRCKNRVMARRYRAAQRARRQGSDSP